jgi:hypothetical protein
MVKVITSSVVAVLLIGSSALAATGDIGQGQMWNFGLINDADHTAGTGIGGTIQGIGTLSGQGDATTSGTLALEGIAVGLFQVGGYASAGAPMTVDQNVSAKGIGLYTTDPVTQVQTYTDGPGQEQTVEVGVGQIDQFQGVAVEGTNTLTKEAGGPGVAAGVNAAGFAMGQLGVNASGGGAQASLIAGAQGSGIAGNAAAAGSVGANMTGIVVQKSTMN